MYVKCIWEKLFSLNSWELMRLREDGRRNSEGLRKNVALNVVATRNSGMELSFRFHKELSIVSYAIRDDKGSNEAPFHSI